MAGTIISGSYSSQVNVNAGQNTVTVTGTIITNGRAIYDGIGDSLVIIENDGTIRGSTGSGGQGVRLLSGGIITNDATGRIGGYGGAYFGPAFGSTVINAGRIYATGASQIFGSALGFDLSGVVTNLSTGTISGATGIFIINNAGTVVNAGDISGSVNAVVFNGRYHNLLVFDPGATFSGFVNGGNRAYGGVIVVE